METKLKFWSESLDAVLSALHADTDGLAPDEAERRLLQFGRNTLKTGAKMGSFRLFLSQFKSPVNLILLFATGLSFFVGDAVDALIILAIVVASGILGFWQEKGADQAVRGLLKMVQVKTTALRGSKETEVSVESIVPGDIVLLKAGNIVPGDCLLLESVSLFVDESALTGESYPVEKISGILPPDADLAQRSNSLWMGTHIISGDCRAVVVRTGKDTEFGEISDRMRFRPPETEFERGIRKFGYFLMIVTIVLAFSIFAFNIIFHKPLLDTFMFSLALAVGLTPQLLPAIISINLSRGAMTMAKKKVIVKRLSSIENLGSMNILCSDKTGTLTDGIVKLKETAGSSGGHSEKVFLYAYLNASLESGFVNPIDAAIRDFEPLDISAYSKIDEVPYDFIRKRLSILISHKRETGAAQCFIVTKGAFDKVLEICGSAELEDGSRISMDRIEQDLRNRYKEYSSSGYRTLGIAYRETDNDSHMDRNDEKDMVFLGFLTLYDPPKPGVEKTIRDLQGLGISLKIITGDNRYIAANVMKQIGFPDAEILSGAEIREINDIALIHRVGKASVFAEVEPNQKERIILALKKAGNVVGYMGDGINDVSALHDADVSISVDSAVDVAKEAADIVLLEKNLEVLSQGVFAGRRTFTNTMKYVFMATSANFGNMFSMAGASIFLPFLPLLPKQVLLINLMTDFPEMTIATDNVDDDAVQKPRRWDIGYIRKFMMTFGLLSSFFDYLTFGALTLIAHASVDVFRTGWFTESILSAALIVLVIRSKKPFFRSKPGKQLTVATLAVAAATLLLPVTPLAGILGFTMLPPYILGLIGVIVALYIASAELVKRIFYRHIR